MIKIGDLTLDEREISICKKLDPNTKVAKMYVPKLMTEIKEGKESKVRKTLNTSFLKNIKINSTYVETTNVIDVQPFNKREFIDIYEDEKYFIRFNNSDIKKPVYKLEDSFNEDIRDESKKIISIRNNDDEYRLELNSRDKYIELYLDSDVKIKIDQKSKKTTIHSGDSNIEVSNGTINVNGNGNINVIGNQHITSDDIEFTFNGCDLTKVIKSVVGPKCIADCRRCPMEVKKKCSYWV